MHLLYLLRPFEQITKDISSEKSLILIIIPAIKVLCNFLSKISIKNDYYVSTISKEIISYIQTYFDRIEEMEAHAVATLGYLAMQVMYVRATDQDFCLKRLNF